MLAPTLVFAVLCASVWHGGVAKASHVTAHNGGETSDNKLNGMLLPCSREKSGYLATCQEFLYQAILVEQT